MNEFVWSCFLRGNHPVLMDDTAVKTATRFNTRRAMGAIRRLAERVDLAAMTPHGELTSSACCLANLSEEYLVYVPADGEVSVNLAGAAGDYQVEWIHLFENRTNPACSTSGGVRRMFKAPFNGGAVLHLKRQRNPDP